ncbi:nuclear transport factor 2 family protein [Phenylobacterium sp. LjRoot225]|uniref:nuclear transport factor 2 family protein n=1 Tax=Phenylobacterium sp. LjRoot225 TaxID=3342285 RepID=UPI003ECCFBA5
MQTTELADRYFASVRARDIDSFIAFFDRDATLTLPDGREISGVVAIRDMEVGVFAAGAPTPSPIAMVPGPNAIAVELEVHLPNGELRRMASFFHLNSEGRIQRLSIYRQGA